MQIIRVKKKDQVTHPKTPITRKPSRADMRNTSKISLAKIGEKS